MTNRKSDRNDKYDCASTSNRIWFKEAARNFVVGSPDNPPKVNQDGHLGPQSEWLTALPIGNGRIGGMIYGGIEEELIKLNEETLWSGEPKETNDPNWIKHLPVVKNLIQQKRYQEADKEAKNMQGNYNESYMPMGNLKLHFKHTGKVRNYSRELVLNDAVAKVQYEIEDCTYTREYFCSKEFDVMAILLKASTKEMLSLDITLDSLMRHEIVSQLDNKIMLKGKAPFHVEPNYRGEIPNAIVYDSEKGISFEVHVEAISSSGQIWCDEKGLHLDNCDNVTLIISSATNFVRFDKSPSLEGDNPYKICCKKLDLARKLTYDELKEAHVKDFRELFDRVELTLDSDSNSLEPTDKRLVALRNGSKDYSLYALFFQYGRYLMISSSRPGNLPANLQGIWSEEVRPPWSSNWTLNINTQMNYWLVEVCNLSECHEPLINYIDKLRINGRKIAKCYYGAEGWAVASNGDIWNSINPVGDKDGNPSWANWVMGAPWLCQHVWMHYKYSLDKDYLKHVAYPIIKECTEFILSALTENEDGYLGISPATSPERTFQTKDGQVAAVSFGVTMDNAIIRELFENIIECSTILSVDLEFIERVKQTYDKLIPYKIGRYGQLQEWYYDWDNPDVKDSHCSFLYGLYPGSSITPDMTPELAQAAKVSLEHRDFVLQGWGLAWRIALWARLYNKENSYKALYLLVTKLLTPGLLGKIYTDGIFQIDANFGGSAGIAEMLLQSHEGYINPLPALPEEWKNGTVRGLKARGGYIVDIEWEEGIINCIGIKALHSGKCRVRLPKRMCIFSDIYKVSYKIDKDILEFEAKENYIYLLK